MHAMEKPITPEELRKIKCMGCKDRTCEMSINEIIKEDKIFKEPPRKRGGLAIEKAGERMPDWIYLPAVNLRRLLSRREGVKYERTGRDWVIHYPEYDLIAPSPKWIYSTVSRFSMMFEIFNTIKAGDICVDVGTCIGDTTLPMAVKTGEKGHVYGVEPMPINAAYLKKNLAPYGFATVIEKAVSNKKEKRSFHLAGPITGHSLEASHVREAGQTMVECDTLANMFKGKRIDFCKIDVQGFEETLVKYLDDFYPIVRFFAIATHGRYTEKGASYKKVLTVLKNKPLKLRFCIKDGIIHCWSKVQ